MAYPRVRSIVLCAVCCPLALCLHIVGNSFGVPGINATYDYVVVGGGTAGLTLASRLAENPRGFSVAVIEAGGFPDVDNGNLTDVPGYNGWSTHIDSTRPSLVEWDIETTPQIGYHGRTVHYSQGRTLGGTSAINSLGYHRGTKGFHDMWAEAVGDDTWTWENCLSAYKKTCDFTAPDPIKLKDISNLKYDPAAFDEHAGPLKISYGGYRGAYVNPTAHGLESIGLQEIAGLNSGQLIGYGAITLTIDPRTATRSSSYSAFLSDKPSKTALKIYPHTLAKKIIFDDDKQARGVQVAALGQEDYDFSIFAKREVIVSAGVFRSPQLLMVSGVGPAAILDEFKIPIVHRSEGVGQNLWDQPYYSLSYQVNVSTMTQLQQPDIYAQAATDYLHHQTGPLTTNNAGEVIGWEKLPAPYRTRLSRSTLTHLSHFPPDFPELELLPFGTGAPPPHTPLSPSSNFMTFAVGLLTPKSRGTVSIRSTSTRDQPVVDVNFASAPEDVELAVQAVLRAREWAEATGVVVREVRPGEEVRTEEQVGRWVREGGAIVFHGMATCKMGKAADPLAVLDARARVRGTRRLRVVDASSAPLLGPGHPLGTVYMIAEKVAEMILGDVEHEGSGDGEEEGRGEMRREEVEVHDEL